MIRATTPQVAGQGIWGDVRLHLVQSADGILTAWLDRNRPRGTSTHGMHLRVISSDPSGIDLEATGAGGFPIRFTGRFSDPFTLEGDWEAIGRDVDSRQTLQRGSHR